jgi:hypothetical protein
MVSFRVMRRVMEHMFDAWLQNPAPLALCVVFAFVFRFVFFVRRSAWFQFTTIAEAEGGVARAAVKMVRVGEWWCALTDGWGRVGSGVPALSSSFGLHCVSMCLSARVSASSLRGCYCLLPIRRLCGRWVGAGMGGGLAEGLYYVRLRVVLVGLGPPRVFAAVMPAVSFVLVHV